MKIVVIGGTGLIGARLVTLLRARGHEAVPASPSTGVDTLTGEGLAEALTGADAVVDVTNPRAFDAASVLAFFRDSTRALLSASLEAGVAHIVILSVVNADAMPDSRYLPGKVAQERLVAAGPIPYTILRATQFFEFAPGIAAASVVGSEVRLPAVLSQPVAADDVTAELARILSAGPSGRIIDLAGPDQIPLDEFVRLSSSAARVVTDPSATYFGATLGEKSLVPAGDALIGPTRYADWLAAR